MATMSKRPSGSWRTQVRRKGHYISDSFLHRGDAELWARTIEGKINRGEPIHAGAVSAKTFGDLVDRHRKDLAGVGRKLGRSKAARLSALSLRLGPLKPAELSRERLIAFGRQRASEGAGPVTVGIDLGRATGSSGDATSGGAIHVLRLDRPAETDRHPDLEGRQGALPRQSGHGGGDRWLGGALDTRSRQRKMT